MNKQIKELAEQAGWDMSDEVDGFNTRLEKFAELIVKEICNKINQSVQWNNPHDCMLVLTIKDAFGVCNE